jgi:hypothetical protein
VLSARFPLLTPPGSFHSACATANPSVVSSRPSPQKIQLVDGGYIDNSGVSTALVIIQEIEAAVAKLNLSQKVQINLLVLTSADFSDPNMLFGDYLAPFQALLSTRLARSEIAVKEAERVFKTGAERISVLHSIGKVELRGYGYPLPLGWRLSPITRLLILGQNDDRALCAGQQKTPPGNKNVQLNCISGNLVEDMNR